MKLYRTDKTKFTEKEILEEIANYEATEVRRMDELWLYYQGKNPKILGRRMATEFGSGTVKSENSFTATTSTNKNVPDNLIPIPYGRKIVSTYVGYAFRPKYITYKPVEIKDAEKASGKMSQKIPIGDISKIYPIYTLEEKKVEIEEPSSKETSDKEFFIQLMKNYRLNNEHIKTSRAGRNSAIFGVSIS